MMFKQRLGAFLFGQFRTFEVKRISKVRRICRSILLDQIQLYALNKYSDKSLSLINEFSFAVLDKLLSEDVLSGLYENTVEYSDEIDELYHQTNNDPEIKRNIANYYLIYSFIYSSNKYFSKLYENEVSSKLTKARSLCPEIEVIDNHKSLNELSVKLKKQFKIIRKEVKTLHHEYIDRDVESNLNKVTIDRESVMFLITLCSTMFVVSGYFYVAILLDHFNVNASNFFTISDYLGVSLDKVSITLFSTLIAMAVAYFMLYSDRWEEVRAEHYGFEAKKLLGDVYFLVLVSMSSVLLVYYTWIDSPNKEMWFNFTFFFLCITVLFRIPLNKFIENFAPVYLTILILLIFGFNLKSHILTDIKTIQSSTLADDRYFFFIQRRKFTSKERPAIYLKKLGIFILLF